jgi:hypothetical protein
LMGGSPGSHSHTNTVIGVLSGSRPTSIAARGYVLACQAVPFSGHIEVSYD